MSCTINASTTSGLVNSADLSGNIEIQNNGATAMTVTGGNVGVGTASPTQALQVGGTVRGQVNVVGTNGSSPTVTLDHTATASGRKYILYSGGLATGNFDIYDATASAGRLSIDSTGNLQFNSGYGSVATAYGCRAWVNFNGSTGAIRASGNVSSITIVSTGWWKANFTNAMPDANYSVTGMGGMGTTGYGFLSSQQSLYDTTFVEFQYCVHNGSVQNGTEISVQVFR